MPKYSSPAPSPSALHSGTLRLPLGHRGTTADPFSTTNPLPLTSVVLARWPRQEARGAGRRSVARGCPRDDVATRRATLLHASSPTSRTLVVAATARRPDVAHGTLVSPQRPATARLQAFSEKVLRWWERAILAQFFTPSLSRPHKHGHNVRLLRVWSWPTTAHFSSPGPWILLLQRPWELLFSFLRDARFSLSLSLGWITILYDVMNYTKE